MLGRKGWQLLCQMDELHKHSTAHYGIWASCEGLQQTIQLQQTEGLDKTTHHSKLTNPALSHFLHRAVQFWLLIGHKTINFLSSSDSSAAINHRFILTYSF